MAVEDLVPIIISMLSLVISGITAYRTLFARFSGRAWPAKRLVLTRIDGIPAIGWACFFENSGARPGGLEDLRLLVEHPNSGASYRFYPVLIRNDYNIFASYRGEDWFPFSGITLGPKSRTERYILFKPLHNKFEAREGDYQISLQCIWQNTSEWSYVLAPLTFDLQEEIAQQWNSPEASAIQVNCNEVQSRRYNL